jgi:hypothetical protein
VAGIFLFATIFRLALGPAHPLFQWVQEAHYLGVKWLEHKVHHSSTSRAKVKNTFSLYAQLSKGTPLSFIINNITATQASNFKT